MKPDPGLSFNPSALPRTQQIEAEKLEKLLKAYEAAQKAKEEALLAHIKTEEDRQKLDAELAALKADIAETKKANTQRPDTHDYTEKETRDAFIDLLLNEAGWTLDQPREREFPVASMPNNTGEGFVDYVLWGDDGKPLALIEAKRTTRNPREYDSPFKAGFR